MTETTLLESTMSRLTQTAATYATEHKAMQEAGWGDGSFNRDSSRAKHFVPAFDGYNAAFAAALEVHPDGKAIAAYFKAFDAWAMHNKGCNAATCGALCESKLPQSRELFAAWQSSESTIAALGYRTIPFADMYDAQPWPGVSKKLHFLIHDRFFQKRTESEGPILHADEMLVKHPQLGESELEKAA
jgi:hypothetical protein